MTRDEQRAACFDKMCRALVGAAWDKMDEAVRETFRRGMRHAFDALHGTARVVPIEATADMLEAEIYSDELDCKPTPRDFCIIFDAMSEDGDLTNPPEKHI
jgi:hypothetical protein